MSLLFLNSQVLDRLLSFEDCCRAITDAFRNHVGDGRSAPVLADFKVERGEFHIKAGAARLDRQYFAAKINGGFFCNAAERGLPNILGLVVLADSDCGRPLAVLDSSILTLRRTACTTAIAATRLALPTSTIMTVCGAGAQAKEHIRAMAQAFSLDRIYLWSRGGSEDRAREIAEQVGVDVLAARSLSDAISASHIVVTCTPAKKWYLRREWVRPGTFVAAVGSDSPDKQEVEPTLIASSSIVCDLRGQCEKVGELHHAVSLGLLSRDAAVAELGEVLAGIRLGRNDTDDIVVFDSTGSAIQDVAAAAMAYEKATRLDLGVQVEY